MIDFDAPSLQFDFIARVGLTSAELLFGFRNSWLNERDAIAVALSQCAVGVLVDDTLKRLALLMDDERAEVREIALAHDDGECSDHQRVWIFVFAKWIFENDDTPHSFELAEDLHAAFEYPESLEGFIGYLPSNPGEPVGPEAMDANWRSCLEEESGYFLARRSNVLIFPRELETGISPRCSR